MEYCIGVDLGTSAVKAILVNRHGGICGEASKPFSIIEPHAGYSEQDPREWAEKTKEAIKELVGGHRGGADEIKGISFSGQMHGLVLLDGKGEVLRNAILWNDTRTTEQCRLINEVIGKARLLELVKNPALEGFTLPKLLWIKEHEQEVFQKAAVFLLPKDYVRYTMTGRIHSEYSDAAGTLLLDVKHKTWSSEMCRRLGIPEAMCPELVESGSFVGCLTSKFAEETGLTPEVKVFAGGADNACGAVGAGILQEGTALCSIGTSGVVLSYEKDPDQQFRGNIHLFNHAAPDAYYSMGVTLSAGRSFSWFKDVFAKDEAFDSLIGEVEESRPGSRGLLFTPYLSGERTPHADAEIRASFIGMDSGHRRADVVRSVIEGITFSLHESIEQFRARGKNISRVISIGGGAKSEEWLQIQADIFNAEIIRLKSEQGPAFGAAMIAAVGCGWFPTLEACAERFVHIKETFQPRPEYSGQYQHIFPVYRDVYRYTKPLNERLAFLRE
ncbi:xylulokinase [Bacillus glycinifermentans]|uniref:Xylulose kinase n=1 Tax=Bacillus glycinifermentans TaxID=1664069 RepID=A0A0T6BJU9_9BACI|nr:xylulokinase [Bacillus glycinifermentans]ATH93667.1 xylulokinase [Bacillus glycinifermentans]KRT90157.1 xylulose kinase [Bacillus glycinifermentans]MEC0483844.1 xylulokinase [Bacillus glycinifermentans]MEC0496338.1 xylulokinase [Bacillus glycinifermentans]MEC0539369.1 xylulokinase [Bacillus glycinifermentans]